MKKSMKFLALTNVGFIGVAGVFATSTTVTYANSSTTIVYLNHDTPPGNTWDKQMAKLFEKAHPGVTVQLDEVQDSDTFTKFQTMVAAGQPPSVYDMGGTEFYQAASDGILSPVDYTAMGVKNLSQLKSNYIASALSAYTYDGALYGIPEEMSNYLGFANKAAFAAAGIHQVPKTWKQVFADAAKMTKTNKSGQVTQEEIALPMNFPVAEEFVVDAIARDFGNGLFNNSGTKSYLTSNASIEAFQTLQDLVYKYHAFYPSLNGTTSASERILFGENKAAMIFDVGVWYQSTLQQQYQKVWKTSVPVPYPTVSGKPGLSELYGYSWIVPKNAPNQKLAWEFVHFLQQHALGYYENNGVMSGTKSLATSKELAKSPNWTQVWLPSLTRGTYTVSLKNSSQIYDIINQAYDQILLQNAPVKSTLEAANQQILPLLNK